MPRYLFLGFAKDVESAFNRANDLLQTIFNDSHQYDSRYNKDLKGIYFQVVERYDYEAEDKQFAWINERLPLGQRRVINYKK